MREMPALVPGAASQVLTYEMGVVPALSTSLGCAGQ